MGLTPDHPPDDGDASDVGRPPFGVALYLRPSAAREARGRSPSVSSNCTSENRRLAVVADRRLVGAD